MKRHALIPRSASFRPETLGQNALQLIGNLCFSLFVLGVLAFTIIAATYQPEDPLLHPSTKLTSFLTSKSNATFRSDDSTAHTGDDFLSPNSTSDSASITLSHINSSTKTSSQVAMDSASAVGDEATDSSTSAVCADGPIDCTDTEVFHTMMRAAIEMFRNIHFYRFGKSARGGEDGKSCDMAWRFRPEEAKRAGFYKDYRRFDIVQYANCTYSVVKIGDYHSGINARKKRKTTQGGEFKAKDVADSLSGMVVPLIGEAVNDTLPVVESESKFSSGKYLIYTGGGDRCKSMSHYLWSFLCALGEAQYLNRTLIMDLSICLNSMYSSSNQDEEGKDFRFYFDFEHLRDSTSVLDQLQFWEDWSKWQKKDKLRLYLVEDFKITPMKLAEVKDSLIMRKFGTVEPDNYWCRVCEGETESVILRPWNLIWKSRRLMDIVASIASRLNWDYDAVHVVRGKKAKNTQLWPNLAADTSPDALLSGIRNKIDDGRHLYVATDEPDTTFFDPLKERYTTHFLNDFRDLWDENSEWYLETMKLNNGVPVEFDGYMRVEVDTEVSLRAKKHIETFNDLTNDCKDGINTCRTAS
ncbi:hypothetical protein M5K25_017055 [Dendrobium thyrsiflorum]|uniref:O-fucosyltransferase family protein n=1 Tax=Dendrobium thyrsiflorum TaxID=117978 RepID=A0ABD0ULS9_DENTH